MKAAAKKSRLSGILDRRQRERFANLLLAELLDVLEAAGLLSHTFVVSADGGMILYASRRGAITVREPSDRGVNSAAVSGMREARSEEAVLFLPGDLPLLRVTELKDLQSVREFGVDVSIAPSRSFSGTNALMVENPIRFALSYDDNSFWNHLSGAARKGLYVHVSTSAGLMFDVDTPDDFKDLAASGSKSESAEFARTVLG